MLKKNLCKFFCIILIYFIAYFKHFHIKCLVGFMKVFINLSAVNMEKIYGQKYCKFFIFIFKNKNLKNFLSKLKLNKNFKIFSL